jgi:hypothetical protein
VRAGIRSDTGRAGSVPRPQAVVEPPVLTGDPSFPRQERADGGIVSGYNFEKPETQTLTAPAGIPSPEKFGKPGETD